MLERATACLKAGARDAPKCAHQASRSKRRLHSTFWTHGAGDLELPPWVVSMPAGQPPQLDSTDRKKADGNGVETASPSNDTFLDFLYPPQALAWLQHSQSQRPAPWESRNVKRLPKGYVPASKRYVSSSRARAAPEEAAPQQKQKVAESPAKREDVEGKVAARKGKVSLGIGEDRLSGIYGGLGLKSRSEAYQRSLQAKATSAQQLAAETGSMFRHSPGDLAEMQSAEDGVDVDGIRGLRRLLQGGRSSASQDRVGQAWKLYMALSEDEKQDIRLKREMLGWLVKQEDRTADAHCISLYWSFPEAALDLAVYQAASSAFLRRNDIQGAFGLHREALSKIPNGSQITKILFSHALQHKKWDMALKVKEQLDQAFVEPAASRQQAIFWFDVAEQPDLLAKAATLVSSCLRNQNRGRRTDPKLTRLALRLSEEALNQLLEHQLPVSERPTNHASSTHNARRILPGIAKWSPRAQSIYEGAILSLLRRHESTEEYARAHPLVQYLYTRYRQFANVQPPPDMLMLLMERLERHVPNKQQPHAVNDDILSISMVAHDWQQHHGPLSKSALYLLLGHYAASGDAQQVKVYFDSFIDQFPEYVDQKSVFWYPIYVHARLSDTRRALLAFEEVQKLAATHGEQLDEKCWAILLHAYSRAHDMDAAFKTFRKMIDSGVQPNAYHFHPLTELLASAGDVEGVDDLLQQYDTLTGEPRTTASAGSRMHACFNVGDLQRAEEILKQTVSDVRERKVVGTLTGCFNVLITSYGLKRDVDATMRVYRWMLSEKVRTNEFTYSALMQALIHFGQTHAAQKIMSTVMPSEGFKPTALHYAILMVGYRKQRLYSRALDVYAKMKENGVRETLASRRAYLQAKALHEQQTQNPTTSDGQPAPLKEVIAELRAAMDTNEGFEIAAKQPTFGYDTTEQYSAYLDSLMYVHSARRCLEAVEAMFETVQKSSHAALFSPNTPTLRILTALMQGLYHAKRYDEVEDFWKVAKQQADSLAAPAQVPDFTTIRGSGASNVQGGQENQVDRASAADADRGETGFGFVSTPAEPASSTPAAKEVSKPVRPARGRRYILLGPLRQYLSALSKQNRIGELVTTCTRLLQQGYAFDIIVWNRFIQHICTSSPSLVLLAFTLTERYMISKFPGWKRQTRFKPQLSARTENLEYIKARYLPREQVMPQYRTMIYLAQALLKLKRSEAARGRRVRREQGGLHRLVGTVAQIQERAPKTLKAVESMPVVDDKWQNRLLRPQR